MNKLIATSSKVYSPGDIITKCDPLLYVVKYEFRGQCCDNCLAFNSRLKKCGKCQKMNYCDAKCQRSDWPKHKLECNILSRYKPLNFEKLGNDWMQRFALRFYLMAQSSPEILDQKYTLHNDTQRCINEMESHSDDILHTNQFTGILNYFKLYELKDIDENLLLKLYGILQINCFGIDTYDERSLGISHCASGLYIEGSVFDHSCAPNACASGEALVLEIRAMKNIAIGDEICIDYVQNILPLKERRANLDERYFFTCNCSGCLSNFDSEVDYDKLKTLENRVDCEIFDNFSKTTRDYENYHENCLQRYSIYKQYYRHYHPCLTYFMFNFLRSKMLLNNKKGNKSWGVIEYIKNVDKHIKVTHGIDHKFYLIFVSLLKENGIDVKRDLNT